MSVYVNYKLSLFRWNDKFHGKTSVVFWIWIEDPETDLIYHWEQFLITKKQVSNRGNSFLIFFSSKDAFFCFRSLKKKSKS